ncbi:putative pentatricopeptide repeat-containing protein [Tanacetum coccineum]
MPHRNVFTWNAIISTYIKSRNLALAQLLFNAAPYKDLVTYNSMLSGYANSEGYEAKALHSFMVRTGNDVSGFAVSALVDMYSKSGCFQEAYEVDVVHGIHMCTGVLSACSSLKNLKLGKELHCKIMKEIRSVNVFISSGIVDVYCKCGNMKYAELVHSTIGIENQFSTTSMILGYSSQHNMVKARNIFDSLREKNSVVWSAMFTGYLNSHCCEDVFELFHLFKDQETTVRDGSVLASLLNACAIQATVEIGKQVHGYLLRMKVNSDGKIISALVDMYSKCGNISYAHRIFERSKFKDLVIYNIMIAGFAHHGYENEAFELFDKMVKSGFIPDNVTFIAILSACRHCGIVKKGETYFKLMTEEYNITPELDHYACMIDLYGRANELDKAMEFMRNIPIELDAVVLGTFVSACRMHRNLDLAREAEEMLLRIGGDSGTRYVQLANIYASEGKWDEMGRIRKKMRGNDVSKTAGCSWVHIGSKVHSFISCDRHHSEAEVVYGILDFLVMEMNDKEELQLCRLEVASLPTWFQHRLKNSICFCGRQLDDAIDLGASQSYHMGKFVSAHESEFLFIKAIVMKILISAKHFVNDSSQLPSHPSRAITDVNEQAESINSDEEDDDGYVTVPAT